MQSEASLHPQYKHREGMEGCREGGGNKFLIPVIIRLEGMATGVFADVSQKISGPYSTILYVRKLKSTEVKRMVFYHGIY